MNGLNRDITVLVAEDDYLVSEEICRCLRTLGYNQILEAANGQEAVEMACQHRPDVVLMDIRMPVIDGIAAARMIQEKCPLPVVILTAYESAEMAAQAGEAGVCSYLTKPPDEHDLERAIILARMRHADLMELRRLNGELEKALSEIRLLREILPICMHCKKIRDDEGYWQRLEKYLLEHGDIRFSHSICPECMSRYYSNLNYNLPDRH